jgi:hypothetical protein
MRSNVCTGSNGIEIDYELTQRAQQHIKGLNQPHQLWHY